MDEYISNEGILSPSRTHIHAASIMVCDVRAHISLWSVSVGCLRFWFCLIIGALSLTNCLVITGALSPVLPVATFLQTNIYLLFIFNETICVWHFNSCWFHFVQTLLILSVALQLLMVDVSLRAFGSVFYSSFGCVRDGCVCLFVCGPGI